MGKERLVSSWCHQGNGWPYHTKQQGSHVKTRRFNATALEFFNVMQGCVTKMITRQCEENTCCRPPRPTSDDVEKAVQRVRGMGFIGLTEKWGVSVCLFHAMFGGKCKGRSFKNTRSHCCECRDKAVSELRDVKDTYDDAVYKAASEVFWQRVEEYGINNSRCEELCGKHRFF